MSLIFPWKKFLNNDCEELVNLCVNGDFRISGFIYSFGAVVGLAHYQIIRSVGKHILFVFW